jgi:hypothetical protein
MKSKGGRIKKDAGQSLIVPVRVHALCVGEEESAQKGSFFSPPTATFSTGLPSAGKKKPFVSGRSINKPFDIAGNIDKGVHLHWFLPDALSRAFVGDDADESDETHFPAVPNRWLVSRFYTRQTPEGEEQRESLSWIVESDFLSTETKYRKGTSIPWPADGKTPHRYMGRKMLLQKWGGDGDTAHETERFVPLTAIGYGEPSFSIYYPNCRNVFGFHDDLADLHCDPPTASSRLSYVVVGWYSDKESDPLYEALQNKKRDTVSLLRDFGWVVEEATDVSSLDRTLCCGMVNDVQWSPKGEYIGKDMKDVVVAVGNRVSDGLSALLAGMSATEEKEKSERLLEALQAGKLDQLDKVDGLADLDRSVHKSFFGSENGGVLWEIDDDDSTAEKKGKSSKIGPGPAQKLDTLNRRQSQWNSLFLGAESKKEQAFLDWYKYMLFRYDEDGATKRYINKKGIDDKKFREFIDPGKKFDKELDDLSREIKELKKELKEVLQSELGSDYLLKEVAAPRYFKPCDPVVLLAGEDMRPTLKDSRNEKLPCMVEGRLVALITIKDDVTITAADLPLPQSDKLPKCMKRLMLECFFVDPAHITVMADIATKKGASKSDVPHILEKEREELTFFHKIKETNTSPAETGLNESTHPWNPLFMHWRIRYKPLEKIGESSQTRRFAEDLITSRFALSEETIDLNEIPSSRSDQEKFETYDGMTILTPHAVRSFKEAAETFLTETYEIDDIAAAVEVLQNTPVLSQSLGGFHEALIMKKEEMQFPVMDPLDKGDAFHRRMSSYVGERNMYAPMPNNYFNPVRAGEIQIDKIRVIDTFGRYKEKAFVPGEVLVSRNLTKNTGDGAFSPFLPPRIVQPSRLLVEWLSSNAQAVETNELTSTSSVCGWLIANFLDRSLLVCSSSGQPLGIIRKSGDDGILFRSSPGRSPDFFLRAGMDELDKAIQDAIPDNHFLGKYVAFLLEQDQQFLEEFMGILDLGLESIAPDTGEKGNIRALLTGRPIALARLSLKLDIKGIASVNQGWEALADDIIHERKKARECASFTDIKFPVRLGSPRAMNEYNDGLIGYYKEQDNGQGQDYNFNELYCYQANNEKGRIKNPAESHIELTADKAQAPTTVMVLMDPQAKLFITSGILPKKSIEIPNSHYEELSRTMGGDLLTSPVLCHRDICLEDGEEGVDIPTPSAAGYDWLWVNKDKDGWHEKKVICGKIDIDLCQPLIISEGWLRFVKREEKDESPQ